MITKNITEIDENILQISIPIQIKKRGGAAMLILSQGEARSKKLDNTLIKAFAKAYYWKTLIEDENNPEITSLSDVARQENVSSSHATKVYRLNFISPRIVEAIVNGTAPRDLRLQDVFANKVTEIWQEQEEMWGVSFLSRD